MILNKRPKKIPTNFRLDPEILKMVDDLRSRIQRKYKRDLSGRGVSRTEVLETSFRLVYALVEKGTLSLDDFCRSE